MSTSDGGASASASVSTRYLSDVSNSEDEFLRLSIDLVAAAKRTIGFLRLVADCHWLHQPHTILESIRRYDELWMPLMADLMVGSKPPMILPPLDIEWVWFCHSLNSVGYRQYCESRFSKIIGKPAIFNEENEDYAFDRCREIWIQKYPSEPFENEVESSPQESVPVNENLLGEVTKRRCLYDRFSVPYMMEMVYLIAAKQRYKKFLYMMQRFGDGCSSLIPTSDILLMWLTHKSYPTVYELDTKEMEGNMGKVIDVSKYVREDDLEETKKLWEKIFDQPYEKAGCPTTEIVGKAKSPVYWDVAETDVNVKYKSLLPRFLLEVHVMVKLSSTRTMKGDFSKDFLRLRIIRCHRELKINKPISEFNSDSWKKALHLYCEFGTKGVIVELRGKGGMCTKGSKVREGITFFWNDLLRAPSLTLDKQVDQRVRVVASITPPSQASYLLKCVPDRVTDDSGAMISDVILKMNQYRPQEGRWLSRTVLDHAGRECFVVRMRVGGGIWRRGSDAPSLVKWEDRIIEIRQGCWSYIAGSIGRAPAKVVGTATPKPPSDGWDVSWSFSSGYKLSLQWGSSRSTSSLRYDLKNETATDSQVKLLIGRQMQYSLKNYDKTKQKEETTTFDQEREMEDNEGEGFVTLVRYTEENPTGKATALLNWKLLAIEFLPEEDAGFLVLLCMSLLRSISEMRQEDIGGLLTRRRLKEAKVGERDWGSVILHPSFTSSPSISTPYVQPWYWNPEVILAPGVENLTSPSALSYSAAEGGDNLYKRAIIG